MSESDASVWTQSIIDGKYLLGRVLRPNGFMHTVISTHGLVQTQVRCGAGCMKIRTNDAGIVVCVCHGSHVSCHWIKVLLNVTPGFRDCCVHPNRRDRNSAIMFDYSGRSTRKKPSANKRNQSSSSWCSELHPLEFVKIHFPSLRFTAAEEVYTLVLVKWRSIVLLLHGLLRSHKTTDTPQSKPTA